MRKVTKEPYKIIQIITSVIKKWGNSWNSQVKLLKEKKNVSKIIN